MMGGSFNSALRISKTMYSSCSEQRILLQIQPQTQIWKNLLLHNIFFITEPQFNDVRLVSIKCGYTNVFTSKVTGCSQYPHVSRNFFCKPNLHEKTSLRKTNAVRRFICCCYYTAEWICCKSEDESVAKKLLTYMYHLFAEIIWTELFWLTAATWSEKKNGEEKGGRLLWVTVSSVYIKGFK